ncbi:MAG: hypothetical protein M3083_15030 [Actinomycetota bacterium]|nr:hypothetical protein [Actinomycetota bacterium]
MACTVAFILRRRGGSIVAKRGISIGADLGTLADTPTVSVRAVTKTGPDRVRLVLSSDVGASDGPVTAAPSDLNFDVFLREDEFGFDLLNEWQRSESPVALVIPPGSRLVRLRSTGDLQHLTLRRVDED